MEPHGRAGNSTVIALIAALIVVGTGLRVAYYICNPSLSLDESFIALNVLARSHLDLFGTLDFNQGAPSGFLQLLPRLAHARVY